MPSDQKAAAAGLPGPLSPHHLNTPLTRAIERRKDRAGPTIAIPFDVFAETDAGID
jgi:hypothetical protein